MHKELKLGAHFPEDCADLVKGLLEKDPSKRLGSGGGMQEIKCHSFFSDIDWNGVASGHYTYDLNFMKIEKLFSNFPSKERDFGINLDVELINDNEYLFSKNERISLPKQILGISKFNSLVR